MKSEEEAINWCFGSVRSGICMSCASYVTWFISNDVPIGTRRISVLVLEF